MLELEVLGLERLGTDKILELSSVIYPGEMLGLGVLVLERLKKYKRLGVLFSKMIETLSP